MCLYSLYSIIITGTSEVAVSRSSAHVLKTALLLVKESTIISIIIDHHSVNQEPFSLFSFSLLCAFRFDPLRSALAFAVHDASAYSTSLAYHLSISPISSPPGRHLNPAASALTTPGKFWIICGVFGCGARTCLNRLLDTPTGRTDINWQCVVMHSC
jgi:hypothetical protein